MIFVTVGTHEQPFNRLLKEIDRLIEDGTIKEKVVVQYGFSTYLPKMGGCENHQMLSYSEMQKAFREARIVITHGGPSSFIEALKYGKVPIVVPRRTEFNEHVNDHQVEFVKLIDRKMHNIIPVYDIDKLGTVISNYEKIVSDKDKKETSNNSTFNHRLEDIVNDLTMGMISNEHKKKA